MKLPVPMTMAQIAGFVGGTPHGASDITVTGIAVDPFESVEGDIALVVDRSIIARMSEIKASVVISPLGTEKTHPDWAIILVERPKLAIQKICTALDTTILLFL